MVNSMALAVLLASSGENVEKENKKTVRRCCHNLNKLAASLETENHARMIAQINILLDLIVLRKPLVSASGFFDINFRVLGFILSTVTTYSIVIIQFLLNHPVESN
ncbi:uncharacterized protein LOC115890218 [Sitophilus oryzae]|uniref:Uncharacterized protein LOC115890218 n=1 Tax=Sitophilus oryzae TaxID=7048 RepID=A0A6J2YTV3_SITOR|nr:uncharacterized protein LOC115890218 [Sitophilus oryzae]